MNRREKVLERRIERIKSDLQALGELRPGSLSEQYNVCGVAGCQCKASPPKKHGPYYQLSFTRKGKSTSRFVRREEVAVVRGQLKNYAKLRALVDQWIDASMELSALRVEQRRDGAGKTPQSSART
jgi:Family of unknown function (DUF6788)